MAWGNEARKRVWQSAQDAKIWDVIIVGGGITGAGIAREAAIAGLKILLLEQNDFASGTSSKSSKLVHGGLRYLKSGDWRLTLESVRERERLLRESGGLVRLQGFITAVYKGNKPGGWLLRLGLIVYDLMARKRRFRSLGKQALKWLAPHLRETGLKGGFWYPDAQTDDARLTLRVLGEATTYTAMALNYARVSELLFNAGQVAGLRVHDRVDGGSHELKARCVINATGAWCDRLRMQVGGQTRLRPLRGAHLIFEYASVPVAQAVTLFHPQDQRPVFLIPWEGRILVGTTDLDHGGDMDEEAACSSGEAEYLLQAVNFLMADRQVGAEQVISAWAGVRPIISSGEQVDPSKESREHALWHEKGLFTVTGGKLTTYRVTAHQVLDQVGTHIPRLQTQRRSERALDEVIMRPNRNIRAQQLQRLYGRYGNVAQRLLQEVEPQLLTPIADTPYLWAELVWAARYEAVVHLQDLLLRRVRVGLLLRQGGSALLPRIRSLCQAELGWDDPRWNSEVNDYQQLWQRCYAPPRLSGEQHE